MSSVTYRYVKGEDEYGDNIWWVLLGNQVVCTTRSEKWAITIVDLLRKRWDA